MPSAAAGGRAEVCRALLVTCVSLACGQLADSDALPRLLRMLVPLALARTLASGDSWSSPLLRRSIPGGGLFVEAALEAPLPPLSLSHPVTGLTETLVLFEYLSLWRELVAPADASTRAAVEAVATAGVPGSATSVALCEQLDGEDADMGTGDPSACDLPRSAEAEDASACAASGASKILAAVRQRILGELIRCCLDVAAASNLAVLANSDIGETLGAPPPSSAAAAAGGVVLGGDLSVLAVDAAAGAPPGSMIVPAAPADYARFLALVEFIRYLTPLLPLDALATWTPQVLRASFTGAARAPHASGFLTLATIAGVIAEDLNLFGGASAEIGQLTPAESTEAVASNNFDLLESFLDGVARRARALRGELLLAALQAVLLAPTDCLLRSPERAFTALRMALAEGASQPVFATLAVLGLTRLHASLPGLCTEERLRELLPHVGALMEVGQHRGVADAARAGLSAKSSDDDDVSPEDDDDNPAQEDSSGALDTASRATDGNGGTAWTLLSDALRKAPSDDARRRVQDALSVLRSAGVGSGFAGIDGAALPSSALYSAHVAVVSLAGSDDDAYSAFAAQSAALLRFVREKQLGWGPTLGRAAAVVSRALFRGIGIRDQPVAPAELLSRIALLLGRCGGDMRFVVGSTDDHLVEELSWGRAAVAADRLEVPLKLGGAARLALPVEEFLPRVTALALTATTRQTKVAACEFLHACVLLVVGRIHEARDSTAGASGGSSRTPLCALFRRLLGPCLRLAVDAEVVAVQLFAPLVSQLVVFFSRQAASAETLALVDALMDAVVSGNSPLRDFSSRRFGEFVAWTVRHDQGFAVGKAPAALAAYDGGGGGMTGLPPPAQTQDESGPRTGVASFAIATPAIDALLRRLLAAARHVSVAQRAGALAVWNNMYRDLREGACRRHEELLHSCSSYLPVAPLLRSSRRGGCPCPCITIHTRDYCPVHARSAPGCLRPR